jgi:hypothetical protein
MLDELCRRRIHPIDYGLDALDANVRGGVIVSCEQRFDFLLAFLDDRAALLANFRRQPAFVVAQVGLVELPASWRRSQRRGPAGGLSSEDMNSDFGQLVANLTIDVTPLTH